jgi:RimJ/RimL family protein N-acetyltransferase
VCERNAAVPPLAPPDPPLTDGLVTLRGWRDADVPALTALMDDPEIARWTRAPAPYEERHAIEWMATHSTLMRRRSELPLAITAAEGGELLGSIALRFPEDGRGEFGYLLGAAARGRSVATRALRLYASWAFDALGIERLEVLVQPDNEASLALAERVGFRREGVLRSYTAIRGQRADMVVLGMLRGELRS